MVCSIDTSQSRKIRLSNFNYGWHYQLCAFTESHTYIYQEKKDKYGPFDLSLHLRSYQKNEYVRVLETPNVEGFVRFNKQIISIPDQEIEWLQRVTGEVNDITLENQPFSEGDAVEVVLGNLTGLKGKLIESLSKHELLIELDHIGFGLRIQIDPSHLRKLR